MKRLITYLYSALFALIIVYLQRYFFFNPQNIASSINSVEANFFFLSLSTGIIFGLISCPVCGLPLSFALGSTEHYIRSVVIKNILFHLARFLVIFIYAFFGNLIVEGLRSLFFNVSFFFGGLVMIIMGLAILGLLRMPLIKPPLKIGRTLSSFMYIIFGLSLGAACGFEATGFLVPLWIVSTKTYIVKLVGLLIFSFSAVLPVLLMSILFYFGFKGIVVLFKEKARSFLIDTAGIYLVIIGLIFVTSFLF